MPYDSNGNHSLAPGYLAVTGQTIQASQHNPPLEDLSASLSQTLLRSGASPLSGNLSAAGYKITNAGEGSADGDYVIMSQLAEVIASLAAARTELQVPTGARQGFFRTTAPSGWIKGNGGTIGNATSGATTRANADTLALFTLFWEQFSNTILPIQTSAGVASTRGASAAADFAANKRLPVFDLRREYDRGADDGRGYDTSLTVGAIQADGIKNHKHGGTTADDTHDHGVPRGNVGGGSGGFQSSPTPTGGVVNTDSDTHNHTFTTNDNTDGLALETRVRTVVTLHCIKL